MKIAPIDIAHKSFEKKLMGLNPDEVHDFLKNVADQMEELIRERNMLKESLREKELSIFEYKERDESLKNTITTASKMAEKIREDAEREARLVMSDAAQKADIIVKDARDSLKRMYQEMSDLKRIRLQFEHNLKAMVQAHLSLIDQSHEWMANPQVQMHQAQQAHAQAQAQAAAAAQHQAQQAQITRAAQAGAAAAANATTTTTHASVAGAAKVGL